MVANDRTARKIKQIEDLLRIASDPRSNVHERESAQVKADAIIFRNRIDRAMLNKDQPSAARGVIVREYDAAAAEEFIGVANSMRANLFIHAGCMANSRWRKLTVVGYEEDIQMAEMLWASVFLHFTRTVFPKWENFKTFDANVYDLKSAGYSWPFVREEGLKREAGDQTGKLTAKNAGSKLRSAFKREAARRGERVSSQPINFKKWRTSFADAYATRLSQRLYTMRTKNEAEAGEAGVLALVSDQDKIKQQFYALFPELNPEVRKRRNQEAADAEEARWNALTAEEQAKELRDREKEDARWARQSAKRPAYYDEGGWSAGTRAADKADLGQERIGASSGKELE